MTTNIVMLLYPGLTQLDLTGPFEVLRRAPDVAVHLAWKNMDLVRADSGLGLMPTTSFASCPKADVLFVPGGGGQTALMTDEEVLDFLGAHGESAAWVTAVCTGSLLLGAAGLLKGYRAATHWAFMELLPAVGAIPESARVVIDRNRMTGGGVTAGIDFGLHLIAKLRGDAAAKRAQLEIEYDPAPPFDSGHPRVAEKEITEAAQRGFRERLEARKKQLGIS
jgi:cyclohexyl-isocyanide hydratase